MLQERTFQFDLRKETTLPHEIALHQRQPVSLSVSLMMWHSGR